MLPCSSLYNEKFKGQRNSLEKAAWQRFKISYQILSPISFREGGGEPVSAPSWDLTG